MGSSTHAYDSRRLVTGQTRRFPIAANTLIHAGVLVGLTATGYATGADSDVVAVLGWSNDEYDNRTGSAAGGANGDLFVEVEIGVGEMENKSGDAVGITDIGQRVFVSTTSGAGWYEVQKTGGASCCAGVLYGFEPETGKPLIDLREISLLTPGFIASPDAVAKNLTATLTAAEITAAGRGHALITSTTAAAVTLTTPTAAEILAAVPGLPIGGAIPLYVQNLGSSNAITMAGGTNVTVTTNNTTVAASSTGQYLIRRSAAAAVQLVRIG